MMSSTPKNSVKPTATSAYIMPSISPFMMYWASRPASMSGSPPPCPVPRRAPTSFHAIRKDVDGRDTPGHDGSLSGHCLMRRAMRFAPLLLSRQLALAGGVFAVVPFHELAVLHHVLRDDRDGILAVIIKRDLADDRIAILHIGERGDDLLAIRTYLFDGVEDHLHRRKGEGAVGFGRIVVFLRVIFFHEELA